MPRIIRTPAAKVDLLEIWVYWAERNIDLADRIITDIQNRANLILSNPSMGHPRPEFSPGLRSFPAGKYVIFYRLLNDGLDGIEIVRVISMYRDIDNVFNP